MGGRQGGRNGGHIGGSDFSVGREGIGEYVRGEPCSFRCCLTLPEALPLELPVVAPSTISEFGLCGDGSSREEGDGDGGWFVTRGEKGA